ncbi:MAG: hypothetical protein AAB381_00350 [Patescibacteria group bacterium]
MQIDESTCAASTIRILQAATDIALRGRETEVEPHHVLLAMCEDPSTIGHFEKVFGFSVSATRESLDRTYGARGHTSDERTSPSIKYSADLTEGFERAYSLLEELRFTRVNSITLLVGLIHPENTDQRMADVFKGLGLTYAEIFSKASAKLPRE